MARFIRDITIGWVATNSDNLLAYRVALCPSDTVVDNVDTESLRIETKYIKSFIAGESYTMKDMILDDAVGITYKGWVQTIWTGGVSAWTDAAAVFDPTTSNDAEKVPSQTDVDAKMTTATYIDGGKLIDSYVPTLPQSKIEDLTTDLGLRALDTDVFDGGAFRTDKMPSLLINEVRTAISQVAMLALDPTSVGDLVIRTDENKTYVAVNATTGGSLISDWTELISTNTITSVNTKVGAVTLNQDEVLDGATYVRTHNDLTSAKVTTYLNSNTTKDDVSLGNVTNESKATMFTSPAFSGTPTGITKTHVGLPLVANETRATILGGNLTGTLNNVAVATISSGAAAGSTANQDSTATIRDGYATEVYADDAARHIPTAPNTIVVTNG